ncbi:MAG TPA: SGNH/GDSL hydrolase family protein [Thermoanaerobaculia bacterium]|nr:SGNH/GDSL hydrolase family protein [Thermoanaerobaculia bacterium]
MATTTTDPRTKKIIAAARAKAADVAKERAKALRKRERALAALPVEEGVEDEAVSRGQLVAEGDSWFDYPGIDILRVLEDDFGFDVESVAHSGDRVEMMAWGRDQLTKFSAAIEKLIRNGKRPRAILLSGGGNDIAGKEFGFLLNHAGSTEAGLNESIVRGVIDERARDAYVHIIAAVTALCEEKLGARVPVLVHGYGYAVPDGRGFLGGWWLLPGPWLEPGFIEKGFNKMSERQPLMNKLINRFNDMVKGVAALPEFSHVKYVDLRPVLSPPTAVGYKQFWDNELHPTAKGFRAVARKFVDAL